MLSLIKGPYLQWPIPTGELRQGRLDLRQGIVYVVAGPTLELRAIDEHGRLFDTLQLRK